MAKTYVPVPGEEFESHVQLVQLEMQSQINELKNALSIFKSTVKNTEFQLSVNAGNKRKRGEFETCCPDPNPDAEAVASVLVPITKSARVLMKEMSGMIRKDMEEMFL
eukprot:4455349-Prymnesium_polylepis.1